MIKHTLVLCSLFFVTSCRGMDGKQYASPFALQYGDGEVISGLLKIDTAVMQKAFGEIISPTEFMGSVRKIILGNSIQDYIERGDQLLVGLLATEKKRKPMLCIEVMRKAAMVKRIRVPFDQAVEKKDVGTQTDVATIFDAGVFAGDNEDPETSYPCRIRLESETLEDFALVATVLKPVPRDLERVDWRVRLFKPGGLFMNGILRKKDGSKESRYVFLRPVSVTQEQVINMVRESSNDPLRVEFRPELAPHSDHE